MLVRAVVVASAALLGLVAGCSGGDEQTPPSPTETIVEQTPAASPTASSPTPSPAPSTSSEPPASDGQQVTAADGALTFTLPCNPEQEDIRGNEEDKKTYRSYEGWRCGKRGAATSGAFLVELVKEPADAEAARQAMRTALKELAPKSTPTDDDLAGQPGISDTAKLNGKEFGLQAISFGSYLALFIATPAEDLSTITDTVEVN